MELFYTVVSREGVAQSKATNSLGGFCSSSKVYNGVLDAVFDEISSYSMQSPKPNYIGLILKNTSGRSVNNIRVWREIQEGAICKLKVAVVELSDNGEMETIPSPFTTPLYADFSEPTQNNPITISSVTPFLDGQMLGIWLERTIDTTKESVVKRNNCDYLYQQFVNGTELPTEENLNLKISFDYATE